MEHTTASMIMQEGTAGRNITFLLSGEEAYSPTSHKMMQGMLGAGLLPCCVYRYNGRIKLMYFTGEKKSMPELENLDAAASMAIARNLVDTAEQLWSAEFLNLENIRISAERVFVDTKTLSCCFMFLPLNNVATVKGRGQFEMGVMNLLRSFVSRQLAGGDASIRELASFLADGTSGILQTKRWLASTGRESRSALLDSGEFTGSHGLRLVGVGTPVPVDIAITKPDFIFGKSVNGVDGTITFNNAISRVHCKVTQSGGNIYISDMGSSNGTYVNGQRLTDGRPFLIHPGDRVRLANSDFELREG